jgi:hypothetical protein
MIRKTCHQAMNLATRSFAPAAITSSISAVVQCTGGMKVLYTPNEFSPPELYL